MDQDARHDQTLSGYFPVTIPPLSGADFATNFVTVAATATCLNETLGDPHKSLSPAQPSAYHSYGVAAHRGNQHKNADHQTPFAFHHYVHGDKRHSAHLRT